MRPSALEIRGASASDTDAIHRLLAANGWAHRVGDAQQLGRLIAASQRALIAAQGDEVIGFARAITDGLANGYLSMVVVAQAHRQQGIGQALVEHLIGADPGVTWVLRAGREGAAGFFGKLGFKASSVAMERPRRT